MTFSEKLAAALHEKNMSIRELSERTGIPKSAIQRYTSGDTEKIPIDRMKAMAEALSIDPAYIMGWDTKEAGETPKDSLRQSPSPGRSSEWRMLSEGLAQLELRNQAAFKATTAFLTTMYPDIFTERTDDDDTDTES